MPLVTVKDRTLVINIDDEIGTWWGVTHAEFRDALARLSGQYDGRAVLNINSPGGSVTEGMAIRNEIIKLRESGVTVDAEIMGVAASIASVIALAGDSLKMRTGSYLMVHRPYSVAVVDFEEAASLSDTLKKMEQDLVDIYEESSNLERTEIEDFVRLETWFSAKEAVDFNFAQEVIAPEPGVALNSTRVVPQKGLMWSSFENIPEGLIQTGEDDKVLNKEKPMPKLDEFLAKNPEAQKELDNRISEAKAEAGAQFKELCATASVTLPDYLVATIDGGGDERDLALAMVKGGAFAQSAEPTPAPAQAATVEPAQAAVPVNQVPPVTPSAHIATDAATVAQADEKAKKDAMAKILAKRKPKGGR